MFHHHQHHQYYYNLTSWFLVLFALLQAVVQADQQFAKNCREYCLNCKDDEMDHQTLNVAVDDALEVSLQVMANGTLPRAQIHLSGPNPDTYVTVNPDNVTMMVAGQSLHGKYLSLADSHPPFSWMSLVLAPAGQNTLLVYKPEDRLNAIIANTNNNLVFVSSGSKTCVMFNCLSGCLIHTSSSALVGRKVKVQPPFTMYLNPAPSQPIIPMTLSVTPVLTLTPARGKNITNITVNAGSWTRDMWYRVKILVAENELEKRQVTPEKGEVEIYVTNAIYTITQVKGFNWTLHCAPQGLLDASTSSAVPDTGNNTKETPASTPPSKNGEGTEAGGDESNTSKQKTGQGAGAGQVTAWVMAGLALFLVMVLALALCTKTANASQPFYVQDSQPSVGIIFSKGATREPEEDSEPESPNELKVPAYRNSHKFPVKEYKTVELEAQDN